MSKGLRSLKGKKQGQGQGQGQGHGGHEQYGAGNNFEMAPNHNQLNQGPPMGFDANQNGHRGVAQSGFDANANNHGHGYRAHGGGGGGGGGSGMAMSDEFFS